MQFFKGAICRNEEFNCYMLHSNKQYINPRATKVHGMTQRNGQENGRVGIDKMTLTSAKSIE